MVPVKILTDAEVAKLSPAALHEYFAPCLKALDLDSPIEHRQPGPYREPETRAGKVYFVGGAGGAIKIGFTQRAVEARLAEFQAGSPTPLSVLATRDGSQSLEANYHTRFAAHRLHGEWFEPHPDLLAEIDRLNPPDIGDVR